MPDNDFFYNKQKLYYTDDMKKTTKKSKTSTKVANFEPTKVSLAVAALASVTLLWLALMGVISS